MQSYPPRVDLSVVMASYLGAYDLAASNRESKLQRAISSFIASTGKHSSELVLVSDGCERTVSRWQAMARERGANPAATELEAAPQRWMRLVELSKQPKFSGAVRNAGIAAARGDFVAYLDTDDLFEPSHCQGIVDAFAEHDVDWVLFDDKVWPDQRRETKLEYGRCGTSTVAHRRSVDLQWPSGYGHDFEFLQLLAMVSPRWEHVRSGGYIVCHIPRIIDA